jgi:hypothetical protein
MAINKGLKSLAESSPNFSNQALQNAINELKTGWVIKSVELDTAIEDNTVLTTSQKNDLKDTINNISYLNAGRYLNDLERHTDKIIDGSIIPGDPAITGTDDNGQGTFLEILQTVYSLQTLIPSLYGGTAADKNRSVNDHLGTLNNIFLETEDSTRPVFTTLKESITFISNANLATETALETAYDDLKDFINSTRDDSTDFQQTLDTFADAVATAHTNFNNALASEPYLTKREQLEQDRGRITTQVALEESNLTSLRSYSETQSNNLAYVSVAEDPTLRRLMARVAQDYNWQSYFNDYEANQANLNPIYTTHTNSDRSAIIDQIYTDSGYPDVRDPLDLIAVADKAKRDARIDTAGFDPLTAAQVITKSCEQLDITTANRTIYTQSETLLNNMNQEDRDRIARALDLNEQSNTLS